MPKSKRCAAKKLRPNSPAPTNSTTVSAISPTSNMLVIRRARKPPAVPRPPSSGAQSRTDGSLTRTLHHPRKQQVCDIGTSDQKHKANCPEHGHKHGLDFRSVGPIQECQDRRLVTGIRFGIIRGQLLSDGF